MKKLLYTTICAAFLVINLFSCGSDDKDPKVEGRKEKLVELRDGKFIEWYPGKKQIKFEGMVDKNGKREGKWSFYSEKGTELSFTLYEHGVKQGFTVVKYPNGAIHYRGEYKDDKTVGLWTTYDINGKVISEKDFGYPAE